MFKYKKNKFYQKVASKEVIRVQFNILKLFYNFHIENWI